MKLAPKVVVRFPFVQPLYCLTLVTLNFSSSVLFFSFTKSCIHRCDRLVGECQLYTAYKNLPHAVYACLGPEYEPRLCK